MAFTVEATRAGLRLTLQLVLVLDVHLPADQRVPQPHRPVEHLRTAGRAERNAVHVLCLRCVQSVAPSCLVTLAFASWEIDGIFGDVEACHDCAGTAVHNGIAKDWLHLLVQQQQDQGSVQADLVASTQCHGPSMLCCCWQRARANW